jgi:hypothetical protein
MCKLHYCKASQTATEHVTVNIQYNLVTEHVTVNVQYSLVTERVTVNVQYSLVHWTSVNSKYQLTESKFQSPA